MFLMSLVAPTYSKAVLKDTRTTGKKLCTLSMFVVDNMATLFKVQAYFLVENCLMIHARVSF